MSWSTEEEIKKKKKTKIGLSIQSTLSEKFLLKKTKQNKKTLP